MLSFKEFESLSDERQRELIKKAAQYCGIDPADGLTVANNLPLFREFITQSLRVVYAGRNHYSARTIIEAIRHETMIADNDRQFKVNNNIAPSMSRIAMELFPILNGLFETRRKSTRQPVTLNLATGGSITA